MEGHTGRDTQAVHIQTLPVFPPSSLSHGLMKPVSWEIPVLTKEADVGSGLQAVGKMQCCLTP